MSGNPDPKDNLEALLARLASGDQTAATEIFDRYAKAIRFVIHKKLAKSRLRNIMDSMDIVQSAFRRLFVRLRGHPYDLNKDEDLLRWLIAVAENRLADHERHYAKEMENRDYRSLADASFVDDLAERLDTPEKAPPRRKMLESIRLRMSAYEWALVQGRAQGRSWNELSTELGPRPDTLRMRLKRALDRIKREVELEHIRRN